MHYFSGEKPVAADYFGKFNEGLKARLAVKIKRPPRATSVRRYHVAWLQWRHLAHGLYQAHAGTLQYDQDRRIHQRDVGHRHAGHEEHGLRRQSRLGNGRNSFASQVRVPDKQRLEWAQRVAEKVGDRLPKTTEEIYALEQIYLAKAQETDVVVQALRIGQVAIATTPTETYALTGLKLKLRSPLKQTMVIELANGGDGYIPPPEQHPLGGYNTWAARSAGLEVEAEPKIAEAALCLLEQVSKQPRRSPVPSGSPSLERFWPASGRLLPMDEMEGPRAVDVSGSNLDGIYERVYCSIWKGHLNRKAKPSPKQYGEGTQPNRAAQMVGGRMRARVPDLKDHYSVSLWIWNGMPLDGREVAGWIFGRGPNHSPCMLVMRWVIAGKGEHAGKLIFQVGDQPPVIGKTVIPRWTWAHVMFERRGENVRVIISQLSIVSASGIEIETKQPMDVPASFEELFFGGRGNRDSSWEGRLDEIVVRRLK